MNTGKVLLLCTFESQFPFLNITADKFEGTTIEGFRVSVEGGITETNYLPDLPMDQSGVWAAFLVREMLVQMQQGVRAQSIHFGVTDLLVRPIEDYEKTMRRVRTLKEIGVTCEIIRGIGKTEDIIRLKEVVNVLCYLLSVARGTKIQYIFCDQYDASVHLISRSHYSNVTKAYSPLPIIEPSVWNETKEFIESAYPVYTAKREAYRLERGTIDAYLDAKAEHDYLEMRAIKLAVAMGMLREVFLNRAESPSKNVVDEE